MLLPSRQQDELVLTLPPARAKDYLIFSKNDEFKEAFIAKELNSHVPLDWLLHEAYNGLAKLWRGESK